MIILNERGTKLGMAQARGAKEVLSMKRAGKLTKSGRGGLRIRKSDANELKLMKKAIKAEEKYKDFRSKGKRGMTQIGNNQCFCQDRGDGSGTICYVRTNKGNVKPSNGKKCTPKLAAKHALARERGGQKAKSSEHNRRQALGSLGGLGKAAKSMWPKGIN